MFLNLKYFDFNMDLILIYGQPAVGKLTVAKELSKLTNYKILHNHITLDVLEQFLEPHNPEFWKTNKKLKLLLLKEFSKTLDGLIMTICYVKDMDTKYLATLRKIIKKSKGQFYPVRLICDKKEQEKRVKGKNRKAHGKLTTVQRLNKMKSEHDFDQVIKGSLEINNTNLSAKETARIIIKETKPSSTQN